MRRRSWRQRRRPSPRRRRARVFGSKCRPSASCPLLLWGSRPRYDAPARGWDTGLLRDGDEVVIFPQSEPGIAGTVSVMAIDDVLVEMGERAEEMIRVALNSFAQRDLEGAESLVALDELIDRANRRFVERLVDVMAEPALREWGLRMVVVARTIERIGDRAVDIGEQTAYLLTAEFREFTDASHPV